VLLGSPVTEQPSESERFRKKSLIPGHLDLTALEDFIVQLYPRVPHLTRVGFSFMRATKLRQLIPVTGTTVKQMRVEMGKSRLFVRPKR